MKKNKWLKRTFCISIALIVSLLMIGCDKKAEQTVIEPMEIEEVYKYSYDFIGGDDVMPIMGYYGPEDFTKSYMGNDAPDFVSDKYMELVAGTGINMISAMRLDFKDAPERVYKLLELGEKYGVGITVSDGRIIDAPTKEVRVKSIAQLDDYLSDYSDYPAFLASHIIDEPGQEGFFVADPSNPVLINQFGDVFQMLKELNVSAYGNILSNLTHTQERYREYVVEWIETSQLPYVKYDQYLFDANKGLQYAKSWFETMTTIRQEAEKAKIPFWVFVQAGAQWNDKQQYFDSNGYFPSQGEFFWNVGASLAFGAKGIDYFPLFQPSYFAWAESTLFDFQRNGLIGAWGNKTRWYYYAQDMSAQIAAVDHVLMNSVNKGIIASGDAASKDLYGNPYLFKGTAWRELADVDGDALVGCFNYLGKTALYVVNYDVEYAQKIQLDFVDQYDITVIQNAEERQESGDGLELTLSAGNSALIVFE